MVTGTRNFLLVSLITCLCLGATKAYATDKSATDKSATDKNTTNAMTIESTRRIIITHPIVIKEGGSLEEVLDLVRLWRTNVPNKIPEIIKTEFLLEEKSKKEYSLLMIYYFKDLGGELGSMGKMGAAMRESWTDKEEFDQYFADLYSYIDKNAMSTGFYTVVD